MDRQLLAFLGGRKQAALEKTGLELHLISAQALLQARAEAAELAGEDKEALGLCLNACILAKAAKKQGKPAFSGGKAVLEALPAQQIGQWAEEYLALCARESPSCCAGTHQELKQALKDAPYERLKWRVLRAFGVLPSEQRAREMTDGDYLYCVLQLTLDEEEGLEALCPSCRAEALEQTCPCCGSPLPEENPRFDTSRFEELRRDGLHSGAATGTGGTGGGL